MVDCPQQSRAIAKVLVVSTLLVLLSCPSYAAVWGLEKPPKVQIAGVQSPSAVPPGEGFTVLVAVDFSDSYSTDAAILDAATGFVLASKALMTEEFLPSPGRNTFAFHLIGRDRPGMWRLLASVRVWWHDCWYASAKGATFPFEVAIPGPANITLVILSNVTPTTVTIDGISHTVIGADMRLPTTSGFHTIEIESPITLANGTRAVFDHWSDGMRSMQMRTYLADKLELSAVYLTEYSLTVESSIGHTVGSGWYPAGTNVTFAAIDSGVSGYTSTNGVQYRLTNWSGDSHSNSSVAWIIMDGPKTVTANWAENSPQVMLASELATISAMCLVCSAITVAIAIAIRRTTYVNRLTNSFRGKKLVKGILLVLVFLTIVAQPSVLQSSKALAPVQPAIVTIGDANWYLWSHAASDTLLIWLGGGIVEPTAYLINPCDFESYNTLRFIQDLSSHYNVLALEKGSVRYEDPALNRTIYREPNLGANTFMKRIRSWAQEQEYAYLYVVGYSVGAMIAAKELVVTSPRNWRSPDGLIIITANIAKEVLSKANLLQASLLLLYGDKIAPEFNTSGRALFENAPQEGWQNGSWYHREYHVIPDVEHEVWTIRDSGEYDGRAVLLTVKFIESCKSLQLNKVKDIISRTVLNHNGAPGPHSLFNAEVVSVFVPSRAGTSEAFAITVQLRYDLPSNLTIAVIVYDVAEASIISVAEKLLSGQGIGDFVTTVVSGERTGVAHFALVPLVGVDGNWTIVSDGVRDIAVGVTDSFSVHIVVGYPNVMVQFDAQSFLTGTDGQISLNATPGEHVISAPSLITLGNATRAVFQQWNSTHGSPSLRLSISNDIYLLAIYHKQYHLNVKSTSGLVSGSGWYDEDSIALFQVTPPVVTLGPARVFIGWSGDSVDYSPASSVLMDRSRNIEASWRELNSRQGNSIPLQLLTLFVASLTTLIVSLAFALISFHHRQPDKRVCISSRLKTTCPELAFVFRNPYPHGLQ